MDEIAHAECLNGLDFRRKEIGESISLGDLARSVNNAYRTFFVEKKMIGEKITLELGNELVIFTSEAETEASKTSRQERENRFFQNVERFVNGL